MTAKTRTIEIDEATAQVLQERAAERGVSVSQIVSEYALADHAASDPDTALLAELDRRWQKIQNGEKTVSGNQVVGWLDSWGTPDFRRWHRP